MTCLISCFRQRVFSPIQGRHISEEISSVQNAKLYSYKELQIATENFDLANKIGEGGFGCVYKGILNDGTLAAIKVLSLQSEQGEKEFLNEILAISGVEHENLVKLYGCCIEQDQRMLVYGYLENNSLARTLLGGHYSNFQFSWKIRVQICIGVAQGLAFLHDEEPRIVHRDIKASNILLDKDFTPKISDFGLAKLFPSTTTHISTRVAGTYGYLAPEYAIRGKLTRKADIYSFGVLLLEIISGIRNQNNLLENAWTLYEEGKVAQLVDESLRMDFNTDEASRYLKIGLLCTQDSPKNRPTMSIVVKMLKGEIDLDNENISKPRILAELTALKSSNDESSEDMSHATMTFTSIFDRSI